MRRSLLVIRSPDRLTKWIQEQSRKPVEKRQLPTSWGTHRRRRAEAILAVSAAYNRLLLDLHKM